MSEGPFNGLFAQQGWQCPICKRVYSPFTQMCHYCGNSLSEINITFAKVEQTLNDTVQKYRKINASREAESK